jgi:hypothetical protein
MRHTMKLFVLANFVSFSFGTPAYSQMSNIYEVPLNTQIMQSNIASNYWSLQSTAEDNVRRSRRQEENYRSSRRSSESGYAAAPTRPVLPASSFAFAPTAQRRQANVNSFVTSLIRVNPGSGEQVKSAFGDPTLFSGIDRLLAPVGLSTRNLADAFTIWWITSWEGSRGITGEEPQGRPQAVKKQVLEILSGTPSFKTMSDAQKQEMSDYLLLQTVLISNVNEEQNVEPAALAKFRKGVKASAAQFGFELDSMDLTNKGFVPAKRRGSSLEEDLAPAPGGEGATDVAAAGTPAASPAASTTADANTPPYVLMAAAGGAGLAGVFLLGKAMGKKS